MIYITMLKRTLKKDEYVHKKKLMRGLEKSYKLLMIWTKSQFKEYMMLSWQTEINYCEGSIQKQFLSLLLIQHVFENYDHTLTMSKLNL